MSSFSLLCADQELNLQADQLSPVGFQKQTNLWPPHTWLELTQRVERERNSFDCCSHSNPRQHSMHRIIKHNFIDLPYQKTCLVWQHWMNLQPGNGDWCNPRTHKRQQQTKHKEISARKPNTRKSIYPFPWHTPSVGENNGYADFCSTVTSEKRPTSVLWINCRIPSNPLYAPHLPSTTSYTVRQWLVQATPEIVSVYTTIHTAHVSFYTHVSI